MALPTVRLHGVTLEAASATLVTVEARFQPTDRGRSEVLLTGLPDPVLRESRSRLVASLEGCGLHVPNGRLFLHLAPAGLRKRGEALDLPLALAAASAVGHFELGHLDHAAFLGELGIDGSLHSVPGGLAAAELLRTQGLSLLVAAPDTAREAALLAGPEALEAQSLGEVVRWIAGGAELPAARPPQPLEPDRPTSGALDRVRGQPGAKLALTVAAAGGHGLLLIGPPGTGKSLLARGLAQLLPSPTTEERLAVTRIRSACGAWPKELARSRPFRAPHHSTSLAGLIGGGQPPLPGEVTLAHHGVLFLDELPEFRREVLESLRQPLESGTVLVARASGRIEFPASFHLVAAMNPCPCGYRGHPARPCRCGEREVLRYRRRISGPLLDRVDLRVEVPVPRFEALVGSCAGEESEEDLRARVGAARALARRRQGPLPNAALDAAGLDRWAPLRGRGRALLEAASEHRALSARGIQSLRRVARTLADLSGSDEIHETHLAEALALRAPLAEGTR